MERARQLESAAFLLLVFLVAVSFLLSIGKMTKADPEGAVVDYVANTTKAAAIPGSRTDDKGTITTLLISTVQQNIKWKAYVGNVSGTLVLRDADDYSIYQWPSGGSSDGVVYITRNDTVDWSTIQCANETEILTEQAALGHSLSAFDNINNTFSQRIHEQFDIGIYTIFQSTCKSLVTFVNNTQQTHTINSLYQEVLLMDTSSRIVYASLIDQDADSYRDDNVTRYDFQAIVPDYTGPQVATYYFYVEISG